MPSSAPELGALPQWDLADLYPGPDSDALRADMEAAAKKAQAFAARCKGRVGELNGDDLGEAIAEYEAINDLLGRLASYAQLLHAGAMDDPGVAQFYQNTHERVNEITTDILFFTLEINRIADDVLADRLKAPKLRAYAPWVRDTQAFRDHQLSDDLETLLHEKHVSGSSAWIRLFDETMAALRFPYDGRELTSEEVLHLLSDTDRTVRRAAAKSLSGVFEANVRLLSLITNTLAKDKETEDRWRNYTAPPNSRHLSNFVEPEVVDALVDAVKAAYPAISHRYYAMKAGWLGLEKLEYWDRNAPLPGDDDAIRTWDSARDTVLGAYGRFSPELAAWASAFSTTPGSTRRSVPARPPAHSPTPRCQAHTPTCCSTTRARRAMS